MAENKNPTYPAEVVNHYVMNRVLRHKLRNLCAGIKMTVERISSTTSGINPQIGSRCDIIVAELDNLRDMTDRMDLLFDALPASEPRSLFEIVSGIRASFAPKFPFGRLLFEGPEAMISFRHGSWLLTALTELVSNAGEAAGDEGEVKFKWQVSDRDVEFSVINSGAAIPPEIPIDPPQPFRTEKSRHDGLGLAIAWRIAAALNGVMTVVPEDGCTRISIKLPPSEISDE